MNLQQQSEEPQENYVPPALEAREETETPAATPDVVCPERIRRVLKWVPRHNPVKKAAVQVLEGGAIEEDQFATLLKRLKNSSASRWRERVAASWLLGSVSLDEAQALQAVAALGDTVEKNYKQDRLRVWGRFLLRSVWVAMAFVFILEIVLSLVGTDLIQMGFDMRFTPFGSYLSVAEDVLARTLRMTITVERSSSAIMNLFYIAKELLPAALLFVLPCAPVSLPFSLFLDKERHTAVRTEATLSLAQLKRVEALPYLLSAIRSAKGELHTELLTAIGELLPLLTPEHYGQLRSDVTPNLCHLLERCSGDYQLRALRAIGAIGDSRAIPVVRRLAGRYSADRNLYSTLSKTALEILPILEAREEQESHARNLLRAAHEPLAEQELLRPSQAVAETQTETLLRPADTPPRP